MIISYILYNLIISYKDYIISSIYIVTGPGGRKFGRKEHFVQLLAFCYLYYIYYIGLLEFSGIDILMKNYKNGISESFETIIGSIRNRCSLLLH